MAHVVVTRTAQNQLRWLIASRALPADTADRLAPSLERLERYPRMGKQLRRPHDASRFIRGPWGWMVIIYNFDTSTDRVEIVAIQDTRTGDALTSDR